MPTLVQRTYDNFTGSNVANLPRLPAVITVPGADLRLTAESYFRFPDGTGMSTWDDVYTGSGASLTPAKTGITGATRPELNRRGQHRVIRFNGVNNATGINYNRAEPFTLCMVIYCPVQLADAFIATTIDSSSTFKGLGVTNTGLLKWWGGGVVTGPQLTPGWHFIAITADGIETKLCLDTSIVGNASSQASFTRSKLNIGGSVHSSRFTQMDIAEILNFPRALSTEELALVRADYTRRYDL
ncbi:LamG-like jellyroll fold domain-containing protein [Glutamicibacter protophormiae]